MTENMDYRIRSARPQDATSLAIMIRELANEECFTGNVPAAALDLSDAISSKPPKCGFLIGERDDDLIGYCAYYRTFSTFLAQTTLFIEDIYVRKPYRRLGLGRAFLKHVWRLSIVERIVRVEWRVQSANRNAIAWLGQVGTPPNGDWKFCRLEGEELLRAAEDF